MLQDLIASLDTGARARGPQAHIFCATGGYITEAESDKMRDVPMFDADPVEGVARAMNLILYADLLGPDGVVVLGTVQDVLLEHGELLTKNHKDLGGRMQSAGFDERAETSLKYHLKLTKDIVLKAQGMVFFNVPPLEA